MSAPQSASPASSPGETTASAYDAMPYPCVSMPQTHPELMEVAAILHGMRPAATENCRVLELGCADGANLLPMAEALPRSSFVGIDLAPRQIAEGLSMIAELGLGNIKLHAADLTQLDDSLGRFDYIICHGLYSWVPRHVQKSILALCARHLTEHGVAYISYNTFPGFHQQQAFREMMRYHTASIKDPIEAAKQALALLELLLQNNQDANSTDAQLLRQELARLRELPLAYVFHEHLEPDNHPCYFHELMAEATAHGLQFLAEADKSGVELLPAAAQQTLAALRNDVIRREQYIDFLRNGTLRSTLLCRGHIALAQQVDPQTLKPLEARGAAQPKSELREQDVRGPGAVAFSARFGSLSVEHPGLKSLGLLLHRARPGTLSVAELASRFSALLGQTMPLAELCEMLLYAYRIGFITLHPRRRPLAEGVSARPLVTPLTRLQARRQSRVSNLWHEPLSVAAVERRILQKLDGAHDAQDLLAELVAAGITQEQAPAMLTRALERFHLSALLTA